MRVIRARPASMASLWNGEQVQKTMYGGVQSGLLCGPPRLLQRCAIPLIGAWNGAQAA